MPKYILKAEAALKQIVDDADNESWEKASPETKEQFLSDMKREMELEMRKMMGETGEVMARVWMEEVKEVD